jgi:dTDP-4-dehydrorhamnose 3,5-epimerase
MKLVETPIPGAFVIEIERRVDERGFFARTFSRDEFVAAGLDPHVEQCSLSYNQHAGTLRGMHYQAAPHGEVKLVRCIAGAVFDVIVDLRPESPAYLTWFGITLDATTRSALYVPEGCAHGFMTLVPDAELLYQMSAKNVPEAARGVRWDDPRLAIAWPTIARTICCDPRRTVDDDEFRRANEAQIQAIASDASFHALTRQWFDRSIGHRYSYHFRWMGLPIIQYPQDMIAMQELIWEIQPDVIVECGVARGGSIVYYASLLQLLGKGGRVIGIDIDIRPPNRAALEAHPMAPHFQLIEGSSIAPEIAAQVTEAIRPGETVMVVLDSNHTHDHVLRELELYSPLVHEGSYLVVFDTVIEFISGSPDVRPWGPGNNAYTAVRAFLERHPRFVIDETIHEKLQITVAPYGYLRCVGG